MEGRPRYSQRRESGVDMHPTHYYAFGVDIIPVGVLGASGYAGRELMELVCAHPSLELAFATAGDRAGTATRVRGRPVRYVATEHADLSAAALVFSALPHGS